MWCTCRNLSNVPLSYFDGEMTDGRQKFDSMDLIGKHLPGTAVALHLVTVKLKRTRHGDKFEVTICMKVVS